LFGKRYTSTKAIEETTNFVANLNWQLRRPIKSLSNLLHAVFSTKPILASINGNDVKMQTLIEKFINDQPWDIIQLEHTYSYDLTKNTVERKSFPFFLADHNGESDMPESVFGKLPRLFKPLFRLETCRYKKWKKCI
jgi:hypothetical protein